MYIEFYSRCTPLTASTFKVLADCMLSYRKHIAKGQALRLLKSFQTLEKNIARNAAFESMSSLLMWRSRASHRDYDILFKTASPNITYHGVREGAFTGIQDIGIVLLTSSPFSDINEEQIIFLKRNDFPWSISANVIPSCQPLSPNPTSTGVARASIPPFLPQRTPL